MTSPFSPLTKNRTIRIESMSLDKAKEILFQKLPDEIFFGHNAIAIYVALSDHSASFNKSHSRNAYGFIQRHALSSFILSLCKLFEKQKANYSIPTAISYLQVHTREVAAHIPDIDKLERFIQERIDTGFIVKKPQDAERMLSLILEHFKTTCPQNRPGNGNDLDHILDALKVLRDKRVAHSEDKDIEGLSKTDLDGALRLLAYAQTFVNICKGFFSVSNAYVVEPREFKPNTATAWPQMSDIIKRLE